MMRKRTCSGAIRPITTSVPKTIVHSHWAFPEGCGGVPAASRARIPVVMTLRGIEHLVAPEVGYGQTLKPTRSMVMNGPFYGMYTNYQITAEVATRAVMRVEGAPTNSHVVVENYNILPPD